MSFAFFSTALPASDDKSIESAQIYFNEAQTQFKLHNHRQCLEKCRKLSEICDGINNDRSISGSYMFYEAYLIAAQSHKEINNDVTYAKIWAEAGLEFCTNRKYSNAKALRELYEPQFNKILSECDRFPKLESTDDEWSNASESSNHDSEDEQDCGLNI